MREKTPFKVFSVERETGEVTLYEDFEDLRLIVEEFWDILDDDFEFWDEEGHPIKFDKSFLQDDNCGILRGDNREEQVVRSYLTKAAKKVGISIPNYEECGLVALHRSIEREMSDLKKNRYSE